jgi:general secretion pathway protein C
VRVEAMVAALKRHFWIVGVLLTVGAAWFVAAGLGEMILERLGSAVDLSQGPPSNIGADAGIAAGYAPTDRTIRLEDLLSGNLFDLPPEDLDAGEGEADVEEAEIVAEWTEVAGSSEIPPCPMPLKLVALLTGPPRAPELGFATIEVEGKQEEYRIGSEIGGATVMDITWNRVFMLQSDGISECFIDIRYPGLGSGQGGPTTVAVADKPPEAPPPPPPGGEPQSREDRFRQAVEQSIEVVNDTERNVQRSLINTILDNQDIAMRSARVMPHEEGGEIVGFKVYGIRRDSLFGKLGMENGDLVQSVNGIPMTGADKALQAYGRLRMADRIEVAVTRRGQQVTLVYNIR